MKELSIKEKAEAYDNVVDKLRRFLAQGVDPLITRADVQDFFPELKESKDEKIRKAIIKFIKVSKPEWENYSDYSSWIAWLEKQGEKDEEILVLKDEIESLHAAIKAIKETHRIELEKQGEQKPEWSEEDERKITELKTFIAKCNGFNRENREKAFGMIDSLRPQNRWKPSDEQIECLHDAVEHYQTNGYPASKLNELYEQMSKIYKL